MTSLSWKRGFKDFVQQRVTEEVGQNWPKLRDVINGRPY